MCVGVGLADSGPRVTIRYVMTGVDVGTSVHVGRNGRVAVDCGVLVGADVGGAVGTAVGGGGVARRATGLGCEVGVRVGVGGTTRTCGAGTLARRVAVGLGPTVCS